MLLLWLTYPHLAIVSAVIPHNAPRVWHYSCAVDKHNFCCEGSILQCNHVQKKWKLVGINVNHRPLKCMGTGVSQISRQVLSLNKRIGINIMIVDNLVYEAQLLLLARLETLQGWSNES